MTDLFGRPVYDTPRAVQPALFGDRHFFELGYVDCWVGHCLGRVGMHPAYVLGFEAARRDRRQDDRDSNCDPARAWRAAVAVGNVSEG